MTKLPKRGFVPRPLTDLLDLLVFVNVADGELDTPGWGHIHATAAQRNVRSNPLKAHLSDATSRKRVGLVCSSESATQWHHNQRAEEFKVCGTMMSLPTTTKWQQRVPLWSTTLGLRHVYTEKRRSSRRARVQEELNMIHYPRDA